ncbi:glucose-6-phosphate dehydrogenase assembly protein OpcA [Longispora fulva]|uniref:Glucose-6-phosphate dehydrogenase assembly protein OpcA n=1 Tax=Longispora fulva TaxID=619741 RepID=A0A8J7GXU5_9ACTN|nr:glucose-6-phosphate dehydrogenase assembly protein OpcA [Longispora fulva]MBG6141305.1 glucose-6-phosphate dehydrogenase assembly protein OpcA [Longispora fulva]GIG59544.1 glucose-6-phosphate dehydrogenase assembly protein OpcA [Longispora fulva]
MIALWDTTGIDVVKALAAERRSAGGLTSGLALTLIAVVDEKHVREAEAAATIAAQQHPCRLLIIVRRDVLNPNSRLDAEIVVGGRLGPCEAIVMRMHGRLALHAESVAMPLLAPDVPVVTWWHCDPPEGIAYDPLGVVADRRISDAYLSADPTLAVKQRADDYAPGDTDLAWTRLTPWRTLVAGAFEAAPAPAASIAIGAPVGDPSATLLAGWLKARLGVTPTVTPASELASVAVTLANGDQMALEKHGTTAVLRRTGYPDRTLPLMARPLGEELAEELRRIDADQPYAAALEAATGIRGLSERSPTRVHIWHDPALSEPEEEPV